MEENESVVAYICRIKELRDKLGDIGEKMLNIDLVMITLNGMIDDYQLFIIGLTAMEKSLTFE